MQREIRIGTIGDFIDKGYGLFVSCDGCRASGTQMVKVDLEAMEARFGRGRDLYRQRDRFNRMLPLYCSRCGSRKVSWIVSAPAPKPNHSTWGGATNSNRAEKPSKAPKTGQALPSLGEQTKNAS